MAFVDSYETQFVKDFRRLQKYTLFSVGEPLAGQTGPVQRVRYHKIIKVWCILFPSRGHRAEWGCKSPTQVSLPSLVFLCSGIKCKLQGQTREQTSLINLFSSSAARSSSTPSIWVFMAQLCWVWQMNNLRNLQSANSDSRTRRVTLTNSWYTSTTAKTVWNLKTMRFWMQLNPDTWPRPFCR